LVVDLGPLRQSVEDRVQSDSYAGCPIHSAYFAEWVGIHER
jgi:hypothetical protein